MAPQCFMKEKEINMLEAKLPVSKFATVASAFESALLSLENTDSLHGSIPSLQTLQGCVRNFFPGEWLTEQIYPRLLPTEPGINAPKSGSLWVLLSSGISRLCPLYCGCHTISKQLESGQLQDLSFSASHVRLGAGENRWRHLWKVGVSCGLSGGCARFRESDILEKWNSGLTDRFLFVRGLRCVQNQACRDGMQTWLSLTTLFAICLDPTQIFNTITAFYYEATKGFDSIKCYDGRNIRTQ